MLYIHFSNLFIHSFDRSFENIFSSINKFIVLHFLSLESCCSVTFEEICIQIFNQNRMHPIHYHFCQPLCLQHRQLLELQLHHIQQRQIMLVCHIVIQLFVKIFIFFFKKKKFDDFVFCLVYTFIFTTTTRSNNISFSSC